MRMDPEKTAPFELGGGDDACLLIHGFTGSPWDMRPLGEALAARYYVRGIRLPGHGTTPEAMLGVSHRDWEQAADDALLSLGNFRQIFVAGLSMGALLGIRLAAKHPERVHALALIAPAMNFKGATARLAGLGRYVPVHAVKPWVEKDSTDIDDPVERAAAPVMHRWPFARLHDLWELQKLTRGSLGAVRSPTLIVVAENDHVVEVEGGGEIARGLNAAPNVRFVMLREGFHIVPRDRGRAVLVDEVSEFFRRAGGDGAR